MLKFNQIELTLRWWWVLIHHQHEKPLYCINLFEGFDVHKTRMLCGLLGRMEGRRRERTPESLAGYELLDCAVTQGAKGGQFSETVHNLYNTRDRKRYVLQIAGGSRYIIAW